MPKVSAGYRTRSWRWLAGCKTSKRKYFWTKKYWNSKNTW